MCAVYSIQTVGLLIVKNRMILSFSNFVFVFNGMKCRAGPLIKVVKVAAALAFDLKRCCAAILTQ